MSLVDVFSDVVAFEVATADRAGCERALASTARLRSWFDGFDASVVSRLGALATSGLSSPAEVVIAGDAAGRRSGRELDTLARRSRLLEQMPDMGEALIAGQLTGAHVDVLDRAARHLEPAQRAALTEDGERLAELASALSADQFADRLRREVAVLERNAGVDRLGRQRRANRLRTWTDRESGMLHGRFELDPESGLRVLGAVRASVEAMFSERHPDTCPSDPLERQRHLQALALIDLVSRDGESANLLSRGARSEMIVVVDEQTLRSGIHPRSSVSTGTGLELEHGSLQRHLCTDAIGVAVLDGDGVVLSLGRAQRLASTHQRRALLAMYDTCGIEGCAVPAVRCDPHHVVWWRHGGPTDLANLLPLCSHHHHCAHEGGWKLDLDARRRLTVTFPDGTVLTTGPPRRPA